MGKLYYAYHLYYGAMNNQERIAPNKALQIDNLQASQIGVPLRSTLRQFG